VVNGLAPSDGNERARALARHRLQALSAQARRVTVPMLGLSLLIGGFVWTSVNPALVVTWVIAVAATLGLRGIALELLARRADKVALRYALVLSAINGLVHGAPSWLFMPTLGLESKTVLTMFLVSQSATAIATSGFYLPAFRLYSSFVLVPLSLAWLLPIFQQSSEPLASLDTYYALIGVFTAIFIFVQEGFARRSEETFIESFEIRYKNKVLVDELTRERVALSIERDRAEAASRAKSRFLAAASHDLRQPMHTLSLLSGALMLGDLSEKARSTAEKMEEAVAALSSQLDGLLDISKLDAGIVTVDPKPTLLQPLLERLHRDFAPDAQAKGLNLDFPVEVGCAVSTDRRHLERILRNLLDNALKYTEGGAVSLSVAQDDGTIRIRVTDSGIGIPPDAHEQVFEEFYQLNNPERDRERGLGLGLPIVRRLCRLLDIELTLRSEVGIGTDIELCFPAEATCKPGPLVREVELAADLAGTKVLIVDDEVAVRESARSLLEALGCQVVLADGIADALRAAAQHPVDVVVADYRLRGSESGLELIRQLRATQPALAALLVSGDTAPERLQEAAARGVELLHKPLRPDVLSRAIAGAISKNAGA
jgi:signal transduction histidine kinase/ActR/RegA family two-component response regulator